MLCVEEVFADNAELKVRVRWLTRATATPTAVQALLHPQAAHLPLRNIAFQLAADYEDNDREAVLEPANFLERLKVQFEQPLSLDSLSIYIAGMLTSSNQILPAVPPVEATVHVAARNRIWIAIYLDKFAIASTRSLGLST